MKQTNINLKNNKFLNNLTLSEKALFKYLQGDSKVVSRGTILAIRKNIINPFTEENTAIAMIFFFDQTTGRIERFLSNTLIQPNIKNINENYSSLYNLNEIFSFDTHDNKSGKITNKLLSTFIIELLRDYLISNYSYNYPDINSLRYASKPIGITSRSVLNNETGEIELKEIPYGAGKIADLNKYPKGLQGFKADTFVNINREEDAYINIPKYLTPGPIKKVCESIHLPINPYLITKNSPKALLDLKQSFNAKTLTSSENLLNKVALFNKQMYLKLNKIKETK